MDNLIVLLEKPLVSKTEDVDVIVTVAENSCQIVCMDIDMHWNPALHDSLTVIEQSLGNMLASLRVHGLRESPNNVLVVDNH